MPVRQLDSASNRLLIEADLPADPMIVFDHLVRPELLAQWWPPQADIDARVGGEYEMRWPAQDWTLRGRYTDFEPDARLAFTWSWDHQPELPERLVTIALAPTDSGTLLTLNQGDYDDSPADADDRESHRQGWLHFLARLEAVLAR